MKKMKIKNTTFKLQTQTTIKNKMKLILFFILFNIFNFIYSKNILLFNLIYDNNENNQIDNLLNYFIKFIQESKNLNFHCDNNLSTSSSSTSFLCILYCNENLFLNLNNKEIENNIKELLNINKFEYYPLKSAIDTSVGYKKSRTEHVSEILSSIQKVSELHNNPDDRIASLTFSSSSYPVFTPLTPKMFEFVDSKKDSKNILLFDKTRELTSVSDWHDLMIVWLAPSVAKKWIDTALSIYRKHADRPVYTLLEPRSAIIEATIRTKDEVNVGSFRRHDMCIESTQTANQLHEHEHGSICTDNSKVILRINCEDDPSQYSAHACTTLYRPESWKREMKHLTHDITQKVLHDMNQITKEFPRMEKLAPLRFREAPTSDTLSDFCWNIG